MSPLSPTIVLHSNDFSLSNDVITYLAMVCIPNCPLLRSLLLHWHSFIGTFVGRLGDKLGCKTRLWMSLGTFIWTLFTMGAAIAIWKSGQPSIAYGRTNPAWTNTLSFVCVGFMSASMGLQGIMGKRMNTQFTTTVVLTTTWCELMTEPQLFHFRRLVVVCDHKVMAILFLILGGFSSRAILDKVGSAGTLGIATAFRFIISLWWFFVPAKKAPKN
ncbi:hypothetical protein SCLCIDRAFT_597260 [Scleroderma citrinum Foug A]|uniref:Uncharacterized protein n=1 Tax=Scleroderma citrinum Foug A TaxID=1036808 RepID=A0A0C3EA21_9AGAM|nr:hypothetical protein SCLCIDRAFT_597260 [Scleroderma citrinum Foug A]